VSKVHCGSAFEPGASGLPYYCTTPVCVPVVIDALAVWQQNSQKIKKDPNAKTKFDKNTANYLITAHHLYAFLM